MSRTLIRNISDTARWAAVYRARETGRPDALFRDSFARELAGKRGEEIAAAIPFSNRNTWSWVTRTWLFDRFVIEQVRQGVDLVVNLAAGLDARPYRMDLPVSLKWVEADLPEIIDYKEEILALHQPRCAVERVRLDLSDSGARRSLFERLGRQAGNILIITEGLLIYLAEPEVAALARDLAACPGFQSWILELASPAVLRMLQRKMGPQLSEGGARLQFGPAAGPDFFSAFGWRPSGAQGLLKTAARLKRLPWLLRLVAMLPERRGPRGERPLSGVCLLLRQRTE